MPTVSSCTGLPKVEICPENAQASERVDGQRHFGRRAGGVCSGDIGEPAILSIRHTKCSELPAQPSGMPCIVGLRRTDRCR